MNKQNLSSTLPTQESSSSSTTEPRRVMIELPMEEAQAVSHFLNGLGWGDVDRVREILSARERLDKAIRIERAG